MSGKLQKKISDLVDTEWFLALEAEEGTPESPEESLVRSLSPEMSDDACLALWLAFHRKKAGSGRNAVLPGEQVVLSLKLGIFVLAVLGALTGFSMTLGVLYYDGTRPVNLLYALLVLVVLPLSTAFLTLLFLLFRKKRLPLGYRLFLSMVSSLFFRLLKGAGQRMPGKVEAFCQARGRHLEQVASRYRKLVPALVFFAFQLGGFALVLGMASAFFLKVIGSDLAFAWQSSLTQGTEILHPLTHTLAAPWRFFLPHALPDPAQIEGSRVILKEGMAALEARHLTAWWPFLGMGLLVYGILPRGLLFCFALWHMHRRAGESAVQDSRVQRLCFFLRRAAMTAGPELCAKQPFSEPGSGEKGRLESRGEHLSVPDGETVLATASINAWELWIIREIPEKLHRILSEDVTGIMGHPPSRILCVDMEAFPEIPQNPPLSRVLALEVFMPPVREDLQALREVSEKNAAPFWIWPVGKPCGEVTLQPPAPEDIAIWNKKLEGLREPRPFILAGAKP